jgi:hypothetical protein
VDRNIPYRDIREPAIAGDLTTSVDLAAPLFRDTGWHPDRDVELVADATDCTALSTTNSTPITTRRQRVRRRR